jgi:micrococcal nuclease
MFDLLKAACLFLIALVTTFIIVLTHIPSPVAAQNNCSSSYPDVCIAPAPPDLDCKDISHRNFEVVAPDPHKFDGDKDGIGCEEQKNS